MKHPGEEELVLHFYGESPQGRLIDQHLEDCVDCRRLYRSIRQTLEAVDSLPVPERDALYGKQVWQRVRPRLSRPRSRLGTPPRWAAAAAAAFLMAAAFLAGRYWLPAAPTVAEISEEGRQRVLFATLEDHLEQAQVLLAEMANASGPQNLDIAFEQQLAAELAQDNRLYRQAALQGEHAAVADVLDQLERILLDIACSPASMTTAELEDIQQRIDSAGLLFKLHVMSATVRQEQRM